MQHRDQRRIGSVAEWADSRLLAEVQTEVVSAPIGVQLSRRDEAHSQIWIPIACCAQEVDLLQDDGDSSEANVAAVTTEPLEAAARTALLRQLPPDSRPAAQAAFAAAGGTDVDAVQTTFEVSTFLSQFG